MKQTLVVSDTSPIRALHHLHRLDLLSHFFEVVLIPPAVRDELVRPHPRLCSITIAQVPHAIVQSPLDMAWVRQLQQLLQTGEAQAIALAAQINAPLLIDERAGRSIARRHGLRVTGVVGLLVASRKHGLIPAIAPLLEQLQTELGFFLSDDLIRDARLECGE